MSQNLVNNKPLNIVCAGECMVELSRHEQQLRSAFSGDVINFSVYLKRLLPDSTVRFFSAVGTDTLSMQMLSFFENESINSKLVFRSQHKTVGLYMIDTDNTGERSFTYWRSDSAAKKMLVLADADALTNALPTLDYFYFSGITLAILNQEDQMRLLKYAEQCCLNNKTVIFDPNFRPSLWPDMAFARQQIKRAYQVCHILLSSHEDEQMLWGQTSPGDALEHLTQFNIDEIVLTNGPDNIRVYDHGQQFECTPATVPHIVDTTSAGDAFNAAYIAARHSGNSSKEALTKASKLASFVIGSPGALIPKAAMPML